MEMNGMSQLSLTPAFCVVIWRVLGFDEAEVQPRAVSLQATESLLTFVVLCFHSHMRP